MISVVLALSIYTHGKTLVFPMTTHVIMQTLLQSKPMGHIWGTYGPHMGTRFAIYAAFSTYGEEDASRSGSAANGEPMGHFFKHVAPFSNIWGLLKHMVPLSMQQNYMPGDLFNFLSFFALLPSLLCLFVCCLFKVGISTEKRVY